MSAISLSRPSEGGTSQHPFTFSPLLILGIGVQGFGHAKPPTTELHAHELTL